MAGTPVFKVYSPAGEYLAGFKFPDHAAVLVSALGEGAEVRFRHRRQDVLWTEGRDGAAGESYEAAAHRMLDRLEALGYFVRDDRDRVHLEGHPEVGRDDSRAICADCGAPGELTGHQTCPYPGRAR